MYGANLDVSPAGNSPGACLNPQSDIKDMMGHTPMARSSPTFWYCCYCDKNHGGLQGPYNVSSYVTCIMCEHQRCPGCPVEKHR